MDEPEAELMHRGGLAGLVTLAILAALCAAGSARAASIDLDVEDPGRCNDCNLYTTLIFRADPGERNDVSIEPMPGTDPSDENAIVHIEDPGAQIRDPRSSLGCQRLADHSLLCPVGPVDAVSVKAGDGDDHVSIASFRALVDGGTGADGIRTGPENDEVDGGRGTDHVDTGAGSDVIRDAGGTGDLLDGGAPGGAKYLGDDADTLDLSSRRRSLRVDLRTGALTSRGERDRLRSIENVVPGRGDDTVIGDSRINVIEEELGAYDQDLGSGRLLASGSDVFIGGGARDGIVSLGGDDRLIGGAGRDRLECNSQHRQRCRLAGGRGNDTLFGSAGPDRLNGGAGRDRLYAYAGDDLLFAFDRTRDIVDGDRGFDRARVDRLDRVTGVENRLR